MPKPRDNFVSLKDAKEINVKALERFKAEEIQRKKQEDLVKWKKANANAISDATKALSQADKAICDVLKQLSDSCGGDAKLSELFKVYLATRYLGQ